MFGLELGSAGCEAENVDGRLSFRVDQRSLDIAFLLRRLRTNATQPTGLVLPNYLDERAVRRTGIAKFNFRR
jgi:hypothetical protein